MRFTPIERMAWARSVTVENSNERLVLLLLVSFSGPDGVARVSQTRLATDAHLHETTLRRTLKRLRTAGRIASEPCSREGRRGAVALAYVLNVTRSTERSAPFDEAVNGAFEGPIKRPQESVDHTRSTERSAPINRALGSPHIEEGVSKGIVVETPGRKARVA